MKQHEATGTQVSLPSCDYPIVVTGVEILQARGLLTGVIGFRTVLSIFDDARRAPYPMHVWVPARQSVWFELAGYPSVRLRIHYRPAEAAEPGSPDGPRYERPLPSY